MVKMSVTNVVVLLVWESGFNQCHLGRNIQGADANGYVQVLCVDSTKFALLMNYSTTNKHNVPVLKLDL